MPKLKFSGQFYCGDGVSAVKGEVIVVSDAKAGQLLRDFPDDWQLVDEAVRESIESGTEKAFRRRKNKAQRPDKDKGLFPDCPKSEEKRPD